MMSRNGAETISARRCVHAVYMPRGNTALQYTTSYVIGTFRTMCRHTPSNKSSGIHQVAVAQNRSVSPFINGSNSPKRLDSLARDVSTAPANVEMAIAPMLIQYG